MEREKGPVDGGAGREILRGKENQQAEKVEKGPSISGACCRRSGCVRTGLVLFLVSRCSTATSGCWGLDQQCEHLQRVWVPGSYCEEINDSGFFFPPPPLQRKERIGTPSSARAPDGVLPSKNQEIISTKGLDVKEGARDQDTADADAELSMAAPMKASQRPR